MKTIKIKIIALSLILLYSCGGSSDDSADAPKPLRSQTGNPEAVSQQDWEAITAPFSKEEAHLMVLKYREELGAGKINLDNTPKSMILEKERIQLLLDLVNQNGGDGGIILYPVINPLNNQVSLAIAAATFETNDSGLFVESDINVHYPIFDSVPSVVEMLRPCPTHCGTPDTDLY